MFFKIFALFLAAIAAFWLSAITGGGAGLILIPILNWLLPSSVLPFALTIGTTSSSASRIIVFKKHIKWRVFFWFVPFSIPAVILGAWLIKYVNPLYLQVLVSIFLIANLRALFQKKEDDSIETKLHSKFSLGLVGFLAGFVSGITGAIGLLFNRFYLRCGLTKEEIVATRAANEICLHAVKLLIYLLLGLYSESALWLGLAIAAAAILSTVTVKHILAGISEFAFRKIGYAAMVLSGLFLFSSSMLNVISQDQISISKNQYDERTIHWRNSDFVLEFAIDDGLEIERPILEEELPLQLQKKYYQLLPTYNKILLEKVFKLGHEPSYEFYCYKENELTKLEFEE